MPAGVRGVLVRSISADPNRPIGVLWLPADAPRLSLGRISLRWEKSHRSGWDVTARLGLATTEVHLASWRAAPDDWPHFVRPTVHEVTALCSALAVVTATAVDLSNRLAAL
ncbi:esterase [Kitasatospora cineracea]|uniref:esterase n=1 Tax=Kitasatospora cineracea TaxID=88074 RepID=UPI0038116FB5